MNWHTRATQIYVAESPPAIYWTQKQMMEKGMFFYDHFGSKCVRILETKHNLIAKDIVKRRITNVKETTRIVMENLYIKIHV